ncbi:MAG: T9SS type A sorting domain-containing protein [bacterium]|nr:T9SS type A sorting domain-containing protein [bacterium]
MKITIVLAALCLLVCQVAAQRTDTRITLTNFLQSQPTSRTFDFAADVRATMGLDTALGEMEIPPFEPPAPVFYVWTEVVTTERLWLSPLDIRKLRNEQYVEEYHIAVSNRGENLRFGLIAGLPAFVDSVYLVDGYTDWPDNFIKHKMESGVQYDVPNPSTRKFVIRVYYDGRSAGVNDNHFTSPSLSVAPQPVSGDVLNVSNISVDATALDVFDVHGVLYATVTVDMGLTTGLSVAHLPSGAYMLVERRSNGIPRRCMFIRQ